MESTAHPPLLDYLVAGATQVWGEGRGRPRGQEEHAAPLPRFLLAGFKEGQDHVQCTRVYPLKVFYHYQHQLRAETGASESTQGHEKVQTDVLIHMYAKYIYLYQQSTVLERARWVFSQSSGKRPVRQNALGYENPEVFVPCVFS